jgi:DNA polymerase I
MSNNDVLIVIDGNSILNRAYYALPHMSNTDGVATNGVYGFLNTLLNFVDTTNASHLCIAFDKGRSTFRHQICDAYKCQRTKMDDNLHTQLRLTQRILDFMNIVRISYNEYEADDIIGTISRMCDEVSQSCVMLSGDRDLLQLVSKNTQLSFVSTRNGKTTVKNYDLESVMQEFGILPPQLVDVKALMGDKSDNISGIPGIGEKTALDLIRKYNSLDNIYVKLEEIKPTLKQKLSTNMDSAYKSYKLAKICQTVPIDISLDEMKISNLQKDLLIKELQFLELKNIIKRFESRDWSLMKSLQGKM